MLRNFIVQKQVPFFRRFCSAGPPPPKMPKILQMNPVPKEWWTPERKRFLKICCYVWPALLLCSAALYRQYQREDDAEREQEAMEEMDKLASRILPDQQRIPIPHVPKKSALPPLPPTQTT
mmetsp:Transcript_3398/g.6433  ORF Transcript_3398/g.6433 Transcript_3398/m.6433 type:complete len:121 (-) Transcript_3398:32-394(-)